MGQWEAGRSSVGANEARALVGVPASVIIAVQAPHSATRLARNEGCVQASDRELVRVHAITREAFAAPTIGD